MYNRLFTKILDSSIWLESDATRIVWITLLAAMDEDGYAPFSAKENLARRANVKMDALEKAITILESPDKYNSDDEFEGRRIEKVQGGWIILKAPYYRTLLSREIAREQTRLRVQKSRSKANVTPKALQGVTDVTSVTCNTSEQSKAEQSTEESAAPPALVPTALDIYQVYPRHEAKPDALNAINKAIRKGFGAAFLLERTISYAKTQPPRSRFTPLPASWFNAERFNDDPKEWVRTSETNQNKPVPGEARRRREYEEAKEKYG